MFSPIRFLLHRWRCVLPQPAWLLLLFLIGFRLPAAMAAPVISEIMFQPGLNPSDDAAEWLEIHQPAGRGTANLSGWQFTKGMRYNFPAGTVLAEGQRLIVAADPEVFRAKHPDFAGTVLGGWIGRLSNSGEAVELSDAGGNSVDEIRYADEGDWARRVLLPPDLYGMQGWGWESAAAGGGFSLERCGAQLPGTLGWSWKISQAPGGTPGGGTEEAPARPGAVVEVRNLPAIPRSTDSIRFYARTVSEESAGPLPDPELVWRRDGESGYTSVPMSLAWTESSPPPGLVDSTWTATLPPMANRTIVEYYIRRSAPDSQSVTWPAPARISGSPGQPLIFGQIANALLMVDNTYNPAVVWNAGARPVYRILLTAAERARLRTIQTGGSASNSDAAMNATFLSEDGSGVVVRHLAAVRNRGFSSRNGPPNNFHVSFRSDELWNDRRSMQLNCRFPHSQVLAANVFELAGIAVQSARPVRVVMNGVDQAESGTRMFGTYARVETLNGEWLEKHFPDDSDGNLYRLDDHDPNSPGVIPGDLGSGEFRFEGTNPLAYADTFLKRSNEVADDWSDLIGLTRVVSAPAAGGSLAQPAIPDPEYPDQVRKVLDVDQWLTYLAMDALVGNQEGGFATGRGDDFALYRGLIDRRFRLIPHDFDTCFDFNTDDGQGTPADRSIFSFHTQSGGVAGLNRLFEHPDLVRIYYQKLLFLTENLFTPQRLHPLMEELLGGWVPPTSINAAKLYIDQRRASVLGQIPRAWSLTTDLPAGTDPWPVSTNGGAIFRGTFDVIQGRSLRLNGVPVPLQFRTLGGSVAGTWVYTAAPGSGFLTPGLNRVTAEFFDGPEGTGQRVNQLEITVRVPETTPPTTLQGTLTQTPPPAGIRMTAPASFQPGIPFLVQVDALEPVGSLEREVWNRTAKLSVPAGVTVIPDQVTLYNGRGSALVRVGSNAGTGAVVTPLVPAGGTSVAPAPNAAIWRMLDNGEEPAADWKSSVSYSDAGWKEGPLQAGAGDGDERTPLQNVNTSQNTRRAFYFRHVFSLDTIPAATNLILRAVVDDGAVFYLNGVEIHRDNLPTGGIGLTTSAASNRANTAETMIRSAELPGFLSLLRTGPNLLAVQVQNFDSGNNDLSFDCALEAVTPAEDPGNLVLSVALDGRTTSAAVQSLGGTSATNVSGVLPPGETFWSGLIRVTGDVTVPSNGTLRIQPGTTVLLDGNAVPGSPDGVDLIVQGRLLSEGTASQPVTLTASDAATCWGELLFTNAAGASLLQHTLITRGSRSPGRGHTGKGPLIRLVTSQLTLDHCSLGDSPGKALYTSGTCSLTLQNTLIARAITGPEVSDGCTFLMEDSHIQEVLPQYRESDSPAPDDEDCLYLHNGNGTPAIIRRSVLARCGDDVIDGLGGPLLVEDSVIREGWDKGISLLNNDLVITRSLIIDCDKAIVPKSSTVAVRRVQADHLTILCEDHNTTLAPWGYSIPPQDPDPDTPSTGFYTQDKAGQSVAGAEIRITASNCLVQAKEPIKIDPLYPDSGTVITWSILSNPDQPAAAPWPGTGNLSGSLGLLNPFTGNFALAPDSPARDSGDPAFAPDPDGTRTDRGALPPGSESSIAGEVRWTRSNSPYQITGPLTVPAGITLRIDPGVHVQVAANVRLTVRGRILAMGTAQQRILFSGIPGAVAAGDADPIKSGVQTGPPKWGGVRVIDSMSQENRFVWCEFLDAQGISPLGVENQGSLGLIRSWGLVESCTWSGTHLRMCYGRNSRLTLRHNRFPDMFQYDPALGRVETPSDFLASADNSQEQLKVEYPVTDPEVTVAAGFQNGFPAGGWLRVYHNIFHGNRGHNDVFDADSGRWGQPGQFILDCRYNQFLGLSGDEHLDLGGDAYIASNLFTRATKDEWTSDTGYSSAISSGDRGAGTTLFVVRNVFHDLDHAVNLKTNTGAVFEYNTVANLHPDYSYSGTTLGGTPFTQQVRNAAINVFVPEDGAAPTRGDGAYLGYNIFSGLPRLVSGADARINQGQLVFDVVTRLQFAGNLLHDLGTTELGPNHPGGAFSGDWTQPGFSPNFAGNPRLSESLFPQPGSAAAGAAPGGFDLGAQVPEWAQFLTHPPRSTSETSARFTIGGPGLVAWKWQLDDGQWSDPQPIGSGGFFPRNAPTVRQAALQLDQLPVGSHTLSILGQDMAGNWQDADPAIPEGPGAAPTRWTWTIIPGLRRVELSEVLAAPSGADPAFVEITNSGSTADLSGWRLSDQSQSMEYRFPDGTMLAAGAVLVLPASATGIAASPSGGVLQLMDEHGAMVDQLTFGPQAPGFSLIRPSPDAPWNLGIPTPGAANRPAATGDPAGIRISEWFAGSDVLFGEDWIELFNPDTLPVPLAGLSLADNTAQHIRPVPLPPHSFIAAGGWSVLDLDGNSGGASLPFQLDEQQEALSLSYQGRVLDALVFGPTGTDQTWIRDTNGGTIPSGLATRGFAAGPGDPAWENARRLVQFLRITEIMYQPVGGNEFEFVELTNTGAVGIQLEGVSFVRGLTFTFQNLLLPPGGQTVVVADSAAFRQRYGLTVSVAGTYGGQLSNSGEALALELPPPYQGRIVDFRFEPDWQSAARGAGRSLDVPSSPLPASSYGDRLLWSASRTDYGTPAGITAPPPITFPAWSAFFQTPQPDADDDSDGLTNFMEFSLGSNPLNASPEAGTALLPFPRLQNGALSLDCLLPITTAAGGFGSLGVTYTFQASADLVTWRDLAQKSPGSATWILLTEPAASISTGSPVSGRIPVHFTSPEGAGPWLRLRANSSP